MLDFVSTKRKGLLWVFVASSAIGSLGMAAASSSQGKRGIQPAEKGTPSYLIDSFELTYPYDNGYQEPNPGRAGVSYVIHWTTDEYPGWVPCQVNLLDRDGQTVGEITGGFDSATDDSVVTNRGIRVSGEPTSVEAVCGEGEYLDGPGYIFDGPTEVSPSIDEQTGEPFSDRLQVAFDVRWENPEVHPGLRTCLISVVHQGGVEESYKLNFNMGEGEYVFNQYVGDPSTFETARVKCGPLDTSAE